MGIRQVILYARVSQSRDLHDRSVNEQLVDLRRWANQENWKILAEYRDDGISASRYAKGKVRDGWEQAFDHIATGEPDALLVWESSRATRDPEIHYRLEKACRTHGVLYGYNHQIYDLGTSDGAFQAGLQVLLAAQESAKTSERVRRSVEHRAASGRPHGSILFGYKKVIDPNTGDVVGREFHPDESKVVRDIYDKVLAGQSLNSIANELNAEGVSTNRGSVWTSAKIRRMVMRPTYAGMVVHRGEVLRGVSAIWPAIVSEEEFYRVERILTAPDRKRIKHSVKVKHLGVGIYRCGRDGCDGRMRLSVNVSGTPHYNCRECFRISREQSRVDDLVEAVLLDRLAQPDVLEMLSEAEDHTANTEGLIGQRDNLLMERQEALRLLEAGQLSVLDYATFNRGWEERYDSILNEIKSSELPELIIRFTAGDTAQMWHDADVVTKRQLLDAILIVTIMPVGKAAARNFNPDSIRIEFKAY